MALDYSNLTFHPTSEKLVDILCTKTQNNDPMFFRVLLCYYWGVVASQMRANIVGWSNKGSIPINIYALNLSPSGTGKGFSTSLIEGEILKQFKETFLEHTFPVLAEQNLEALAAKRAIRKGTDPNDELVALEKEFNMLGSLLFSFDSATTPAVKQMRQKLLMGNAGSVNLQIDEIGANFVGQIEVLNTFLELYDKGLVKDKLVKSTSENVRFERIDGATPTNMLLFGTPSKLLDGGVTEQHLMDMLEMGYARRCLFGMIRHTHKADGLSAEDLLEQMFNADHDAFIEDLSNHFATLAELVNVNKDIFIPREVCLSLLEYKLYCEERGRAFNDHEAIKKSEMDHRYFKALKLAGAYAFIDGSPEITNEHVEYAVAMTEASGKAVEELLTPERNHVKLAKYLANSRTELTLADLDQDLPFFKGSRTQKDDMIALAIAWGYKNHIVIHKAFNDGILFLRGKALQETNLDEMILTYSDDMTTGYENALAPFDKLDRLVGLDGHHWINHHLVRGDLVDPETGRSLGYRKEDNIIPGFNMLVLDIDGTCQLSTAKMLLRDYKALYYTTKSHTDKVNRFRIILPMTHILELDAKDYKEFFNNVVESLPFDIDESGNHRVKKWLTNPGEIEYTDGLLFDPLPFIPRTSKNEERKIKLQDQQNLDNLERWVINNIGDGNRNVQLHRYAMILVDAGYRFDEIRRKVLDLNAKCQGPLDEGELTATIFTTVAKALDAAA
ncbi:primase C-terminal domain-containing protein [Acinetobacter baumannii]|nr:primase C-terminal domain-containing protein [Acinetobacter baumannii]HCW3892789.1 primase C-terminal domain-containing protein [Acinetobacter baumannii]